MSLDALINNMSNDVYENMKMAVETGKWPDGKALTEEQLAHSLQVVMAYQAKVLKSDEQFNVGADGQIVNKSKSELRAQFADTDVIARFSNDKL